MSVTVNLLTWCIIPEGLKFSSSSQWTPQISQVVMTV